MAAADGNSRSDFVPEPSAASLTYGRGGGCFLTRGRAALLAAAIIGAIVLAAAFGRYVWAPPQPFGPLRGPTNVVSSAGSAASDEEKPTHRLPSHVVPVRYRLHLWPVLDKVPEDSSRSTFSFEGRLALTVRIDAEGGTDRILLHAADTLAIRDEDIVLTEWSPVVENFADVWEQFPTYGVPDNVTQRITRTVHRTPELDLLELRSEQLLEDEEWYIVFIKFSGTLGDSLTGFYRSSYHDLETHAKRWLAVTHMQPTYAREAFPCLDEPVFRAHFRLSVACANGTSAIANAPLKYHAPVVGAPTWQWHHFEESIPMPTYLVAVAVTDFKSIEPNALRIKWRRKKSGRGDRGVLEGADDPDDLTAIKDLLDDFDGDLSSEPNTIAQMADALLRENEEEEVETHVRLWARPSLLKRGRYAVNMVPELLDFYEAYFGVAYPLTKIDLLAIPDFDAGAMENWGLVVFREEHLLVDEETDGVAALETVGETVAHEIAHQWLGNLVTPAWWDELWLNEGFSQFVQNTALDYVEPKWKMGKRFQTVTLQSSLLADSSRATRAVAARLHSKHDVMQAFDTIVYDKGACLLRMLCHALGALTFRKGVVKYIRAWQHNSTTETRLWEPLTEAVNSTTAGAPWHQRLPANATVGQVMSSWTRSEGYPVVNVTLDRAAGKVTFTQEHFEDRTWERNCTRHFSSEQLWSVPLSMATRAAAARNASALEDTRPRAWLVNRTLELPLAELDPPPGPRDWMVVNLQQTGYFRVNYDLDNWRLLSEQLRTNHSVLPAAVRAQLLSDAFALAFAGQLPYGVALNLTLYLPSKELDPAPWSAALSGLNVIYAQLVGQPQLVVLERYMQRLLRTEWDRVAPSDPSTVASPSEAQSTESRSAGSAGSPALSHEALLHRALVVDWACDVHLDKCEDWARRAVHLWRVHPDAPSSVPVLLRSTAYCSAVASGAADVWEFMWQQYLASRKSGGQDGITHQATLLKALACTSDPARAASLLARALDDQDIRQQDIGLVWMAAATAPVASLVEFRYLREHWEAIRSKFGASSVVSTSILSAAALSLSSQSDLEDLRAFRAQHNETLGAASRNLDLGEEDLKTAIEWRRLYHPDVRQWIETALENPRLFS